MRNSLLALGYICIFAGCFGLAQSILRHEDEPQTLTFYPAEHTIRFEVVECPAETRLEMSMEPGSWIAAMAIRRVGSKDWEFTHVIDRPGEYAVAGASGAIGIRLRSMETTCDLPFDGPLTLRCGPIHVRRKIQ